MANAVAMHTGQPKVSAAPGIGTFVAVFFTAWLAVVLFLGARGAFVAAGDRPPLGLLIGVVLPLSIFVIAYLAFPAVREFILSADPRVLVGIQAWRWAGFGFINLYFYKVLPGVFAWPAGLGDMAIGATAPLILSALLRNPEFAASKRFVLWNLSGILDFAVALTIGAVGRQIVPKLFAAVPTSPMTHLPLILIPAFLVPMFLMLHITMLLQARRLNR
jgi:hypothetical protein